MKKQITIQWYWMGRWFQDRKSLSMKIFIFVRSKIATVHVVIKTNSEGLYIGRKHRNPILDSRIFADYQVH
jgi:hypothetical protein